MCEEHIVLFFTGLLSNFHDKIKMHVMFTITLTELSISLLGLVIKDGKVRHFVLLRGDIRHMSFFFFLLYLQICTLSIVTLQVRLERGKVENFSMGSVR